MVEIGFLPSCRQKVEAAIGVEKVVGANAKERMVERHLPRAAPKLQAHKTGAALKIEQPLKAFGAEKWRQRQANQQADQRNDPEQST